MYFSFLYLLGEKFTVGQSHLFRRRGEKMPCFSVALLSLVQMMDLTVCNTVVQIALYRIF